MEMRISVVSPILNEEKFIKVWLTSVCKYADEIVLTDTGSTDKTLEIIQAHNFGKVKIDFRQKPVDGLPYAEWKQWEIRNDLINRATGDIICIFDADEIINVNDAQKMFKDIDNSYFDSYSLKIVQFWGNFDTVRLNQIGDMNWENWIRRIIKKRSSYVYTEQNSHCTLIDNRSIRQKYLPYFIYHLHYGILNAKDNDNRRWDIMRPSNNILTVPYSDKMHGEKPKEIEMLVKSQMK